MKLERYAKKKERLFAIEQLLTGKKRGEVAHEFGVDESTVGRWIRDYNKNGLGGLKDKRVLGIGISTKIDMRGFIFCLLCNV